MAFPAILYQGVQVIDDGFGMGGVYDLVVGNGLVWVRIAGRSVLVAVGEVMRWWMGGVENGRGARVDACCCVDGARVLFGDGEGILGALEAGAGDDELCAADLASSVDNSAEIVVVTLFAVVDTPEYGVGQVDADLGPGWSISGQFMLYRLVRGSTGRSSDRREGGHLMDAHTSMYRGL